MRHDAHHNVSTYLKRIALGALMGSILACAIGESPPPGSMHVVVPLRDLPAGTVVRGGDLGTVDLPWEMVPDQAFTAVEDAVGRTTNDRLLRHELLRAERLSGPPPARPLHDKEWAREAGDTVMVLVAARALSPGEVLVEQDVYAMEILPRYLPEGVFLSLDQVVGRTVASPIYGAEFIRTERLAY